MTTAMDALLIGFIGASYSLILLFYTTGILLNLTRFDGTDIPPYLERLQAEYGFHILLICTVLSAIGLGTAGILHLLDHAYATDMLTASAIPFLGALLYFVRRMHSVTRPQ